MTPLDVLRTKYPHLGWAVYAFDPGGPVTLECLAPDGSIFKFTGTTEHDAIMAGFADDLAPAIVDLPTTAAPNPATVPTPTTTSIFD